MNFKEAKSIVRSYLQSTYTDRDLVRALDHARAGKLSYLSCCCFEGVPFAGKTLHGNAVSYYCSAMSRPARDSLPSDAYYYLHRGSSKESDEDRRRILIPMILAEIKRRRVLVSEPDRQSAIAATEKI